MTGTLRENPVYTLIISGSVLLRMRNISDKKTSFKLNNFFFRKSCRLCNNVKEYCRAGQATDNNIAHAHCMLDT
jgi:hypothetical protein